MDDLQRSNKLAVIIVDDNRVYREEVRDKLLKEEFVVFASNENRPSVYSISEIRSSGPVANFPPEGADLILLDCMDDNGGCYWNVLLAALRLHHPRSLILLISKYNDEDLNDRVEAAIQTGDSSLGLLFKGDPLLSFLPKSSVGESHLDKILAVCHQLAKQKESLQALQGCLLNAAAKAALKLRDIQVGELVKTHQMEGKKDTKNMDVVTEDHIKREVGPLMHYHDVVICTEEKGSHNELYHRIGAPRFFVFSDPFDGSSAFEKLVERFVKKDERLADLKLKEFVNLEDVVMDWIKHHGNISLNSPIISIVLAERHRVVFAIILNLFTMEAYISTESGNYQLVDWDLETMKMLPEVFSEHWVEFDMRRLKNESGNFLCTLSAVKFDKGERSSHYLHADECLGPMLRKVGDWRQSFSLRRQQNDFTPGPARVLFLSDTRAADQYYSDVYKTMKGEEYSSILSAGEPLTEWIGWLAFLRHMKGLSLFCLRRKGMASGRCPHKRSPEDISTLQPDEPISIFRKGFLDLGVLQTAYGSRMRSYCDTLLVVHNDNDKWRNFLMDGEEDLFERIFLSNSWKR